MTDTRRTQGYGTYDQYDAEWESADTGRTAYRPGSDDDYCEGCDGDIVNNRCACDDLADLRTMTNAEAVAYYNICNFPGLCVGNKTQRHLPIMQGILEERGILAA